MADFAKLVAIVLASLAFSAGLYVQAELPFPSALIVGITMFLVLASAFAALSRTRRYAALIDEFEVSAQRVESLVGQMHDFEPAADQTQLDQIKTRIDALEKSVAHGAHAPAGAIDEVGAAGHMAQLHRLDADVNRLATRMDVLRQQVELQAHEHHDKVAAELKVLETLIKQLAERMAVNGETSQWGQPGTTRMTAPAASGPPASASPKPKDAAPQAPSPASDAPPRAPTGAEWEAAVLEAVRRSVEANKIDLYLQPIVTLPQRRVRYYEALTRLRDGAGRLLMPKDYLRVAESAGMMPLIDNVMLFRSVQVLRRLSERNSARGVFCNISLHSLLDPEFFPEFVAFMEQNRALADSLFFEFAQPMYKSFGPIEQESLRSLAGLGFRFALDQVDDLDVDFQALHNSGFRFIKISADLLLHRVVEAGARIHPADMRAWLERQGLQFIVEKIEDERGLAVVLDYDVTLGQGFLFSEPRPVRPEVFDTPAEAAAA